MSYRRRASPPRLARRVNARAPRDTHWCPPGCRCSRCMPAGPADSHPRFRRWEVAIIIFAALLGFLLSGAALLNVIAGPY